MSAIRTELRRKAVHVAMGAGALLLRWLTPVQAAACALAAVAFNAVLLHRLTRGALLREGERARGFSAGILLYPVAVLGLIVAFRSRPELAAAGWGLLAFGDGAAGASGLLLGGPRLPWNREKTWAGLAAFVVFGTAAATFLLHWVPPHEGSGMGPLAIGLSAAAVAALAESSRSGIDDNLVVALFGGAALQAAALVEPSLLLAARERILADALAGAGINAALAVAAFAARGVGPSGAVGGAALGTALYALGGWPAFATLFGLFVVGTAATRAGHARKLALGLAQERGGRRGAKHAFANATAGVLFAFLAVATPHGEIFQLAVVAAFATATMDTVSTEIGQAFGRRHYRITSLRRVAAGTDGAVSVEGTAAGVAAAGLIALAGHLVGWAPGPGGIAVVILAAVAGTTLESILGAAMSSRGERIDNEVANLLNTLAGGVAAILLHGLAG